MCSSLQQRGTNLGQSSEPRHWRGLQHSAALCSTQQQPLQHQPHCGHCHCTSRDNNTTSYFWPVTKLPIQNIYRNILTRHSIFWIYDLHGVVHCVGRRSNNWFVVWVCAVSRPAVLQWLYVTHYTANTPHQLSLTADIMSCCRTIQTLQTLQTLQALCSKN